jgi:hypothetical protein
MATILCVRFTECVQQHALLDADPEAVDRAKQGSDGEERQEVAGGRRRSEPEEQRAQVAGVSNEAVGAVADDCLVARGHERARVEPAEHPHRPHA